MNSRRDFLKIGGLSLGMSGFVQSAFGAGLGSHRKKLINLVKDVQPLTARDYAARQDKLTRLLVENKLDGLFLPAGGTNLKYFFNVSWKASERTFGVILRKRGAPIWVCPAFEIGRAYESIPQGQEVRTWHEHESPFRLMAGILGGKGRLALGPVVRSFVHFSLRREAPNLELVDGSAITEACRGIKSDKEIAFMDLANRIIKLAYRQGFAHLRRGMKPGDLDDRVRKACQQMGVQGASWPQFGANSAFPHGSKKARTLQPGDVVLIDGGCYVEGYRSDVTRTIVFGKPTDEQRKLWDVVKRAQSAALAAVRPGVACQEIDRVARRMIESAGYGPGYKFFSHRVGHGIGMDGHEYPYLVEGNQLKLQPGMTFSDEPGIYIHQRYGIRIEDCFVVTPEGGRVLGGLESTAIDRPFG